MIKDQDTMQLRLKAICNADLRYKKTFYKYRLNTMDEAVALYEFINGVKTNKVINYSIIDTCEDKQRYQLEIIVEHQFNDSSSL